MREVKEPEIRLFGRKIVLPDDGIGGDEDKEERRVIEDEEDEEEEEQKLCDSEPQESDHNQNEGEELPNTDENSESDEDPKTPSRDEDGLSENHPKAEETEATTNGGQQKPLKKPDKILPCPRCNSMDTKFCYYNNYNVNQPRHFCKSCQRYWTAGGTMRNVPVGAGRRKNKNSASHCRHITITEALQAARIDSPHGFHHPAFKPNGTVLSFGPDAPLCESVASALNLQDKRIPNGIRNGYSKVNIGNPVAENGADPLIRSSVNTINPMAADGIKPGIQQPAMQNMNGFPPCIPGAPWPYPWNSALPVPAIYPPGYPIPVYPTPYWNCPVPNAWNVPWLSTPSPTNSIPAASVSGSGSGSGPNSPLGKHSRNGELLFKGNTSESKESSESPIVVPKTLRIDDPEEAAKSSIWETLGIKYDSIRREGLFKALQPKSDEKKAAATNSPVLQANPAALSRSISFQEGA